MSTWTLRPAKIPDDFARMAAIFTACSPEPTSVEELVEQERLAKFEHLHRLVAVDEHGFVGAYGHTRRTAEQRTGRFTVKAWVDPACRHQGLGRMLLDVLEDWAVQHGATEFESYLRDNDRRALAFARDRGFAIDRHVFESTLDPATFDETPFAGVVERAEASGIRFFTMAEEPGEATERKLYELYRRTAFDIPGFSLQTFPPFEEFRGWLMESESSRPDLMIIAADGDHFAGCTVMIEIKSSGALYTDYTGVDREYRGRSLALALKLLAIRAARRVGAPYMRTNNDSQNAPMLAVNRKLGYVSCPGSYQMKRNARASG